MLRRGLATRRQDTEGIYSITSLINAGQICGLIFFIYKVGVYNILQYESIRTLDFFSFDVTQYKLRSEIKVWPFGRGNIEMEVICKIYTYI